jgi:hypothetical protein
MQAPQPADCTGMTFERGQADGIGAGMQPASTNGLLGAGRASGIASGRGFRAMRPANAHSGSSKHGVADASALFEGRVSQVPKLSVHGAHSLSVHQLVDIVLKERLQRTNQGVT